MTNTRTAAQSDPFAALFNAQRAWHTSVPARPAPVATARQFGDAIAALVARSGQTR